jgi:hypothetical protein
MAYIEALVGEINRHDHLHHNQPNARPWQEHKVRINAAWSLGAAAYIDTGKRPYRRAQPVVFAP